MHCRHPVTPSGDGMVSPAAACHLQRTAYGARLTMHCQWDDSAVFRSLVTLTFDPWPWHSNSFERRTKHVFPVNLAQIRSVVPEIFDAETKKNEKVTDGAGNRTLLASGNELINLCSVVTLCVQTRVT